MEPHSLQWWPLSTRNKKKTLQCNIPHTGLKTALAGSELDLCRGEGVGSLTIARSQFCALQILCHNIFLCWKAWLCTCLKASCCSRIKFLKTLFLRFFKYGPSYSMRFSISWFSSFNFFSNCIWSEENTSHSFEEVSSGPTCSIISQGFVFAPLITHERVHCFFIFMQDDSIGGRVDSVLLCLW